jgi:glycosyltransferase involved in cell wall biosynthesis
MRVLNHVAFESYWGTHVPCNVLDLDEGPTVGGGEEAGLRAAVGLTALGHSVETWWYGGAGTWRGAVFHSLQDSFYPEVISQEWDVVIGWSGLKALEWAQKRKDGTYPIRAMAQQLNDLTCRGDWSKVDCIISPSKSHAEQLSIWGWKNKPHAVVHNGLDPEKYANAPAWADRPYDVGYWSSPDRGLHHLLMAWPLVRAAEPRAKLHVFYEIDRYLRGGVGSIGLYGDRARLLAHLVPRAKLDPSIIFHGAIPRNQLAPIQKRCRVHCYPYDTIQFCEGFAGAVNQGIAAGCLVMTTPKDALPSLYGDTIHWMPDAGESAQANANYFRWLASQIVLGLHGELPNQAQTLANAKVKGMRYTWDAAALEMECACKGEGWVTL